VPIARFLGSMKHLNRWPSGLTARIQQLSGPEDITDELRSLAGLIRMKQRVTHAGGRPIKKRTKRAKQFREAKRRQRAKQKEAK